MTDSSVSPNNELGIRQKAKALGIDLSAIIDDLKGRISTKNQEECSVNIEEIRKELVEGIIYYVKKYGLRRFIIGQIVTGGSAQVDVYIDTDGKIIERCPACLRFEMVSYDSAERYFDEPDQLVRSLLWQIVISCEDNRKSLERYCPNLDDL